MGRGDLRRFVNAAAVNSIAMAHPPKARNDATPRVRTLGAAWRDASGRGENNFDAIRLAAASAVVLSHAFEIVAGGRSAEPLSRLTGQISLGELGVLVFFATSGFLIANSWRRRPEAGHFIDRRARRLLPALTVNVALLAFVVGPLVSRLAPAAYFADPAPWRFLLSAALINVQWTLPGVFEAAPLAGAVNYPLWSLFFEAIGYALIAVIGVTRLPPLPTLATVFSILMVIHAAPPSDAFGAAGAFAFRLSLVLPSFCAGAIAAYAADAIVLSRGRALAAAAALVFFGAVGGFVAAFSIAGVYLVLWVSVSRLGPVARVGRYGDFSYGVYLWGWPVQQLVQTTLAPNDWLGNLVFAAPGIAIAAVLSWRLVERPMLRGARRGRADSTQVATPGGGAVRPPGERLS